MNRIRKYNNHYQVIITNSNNNLPFSNVILGTTLDQYIHNYKLVTFHSLQDALYLSYNYPDINWHKIILDHKYIYHRLLSQINNIIKASNVNYILIPHLLSPDQLKQSIFNKIMKKNNDRINDKYIISFTITNPWFINLSNLATVLINHREHLYRNDLRLFHKKIIDNSFIYIYGKTENGTIYTIELIPSLIYDWMVNNGNLSDNLLLDKSYKKIIDKQKVIDNIL